MTNARKKDGTFKRKDIIVCGTCTRIFLSNLTLIPLPPSPRVLQRKRRTSTFTSCDTSLIGTPLLKLWIVSGDLSMSYLSLIPMSEALISTLGPPVILWYFIHFRDARRLTLAQNPHFYESLPNSPTSYGPTFNTQPTEDYRGTVYILTNNERRVYLELGQKRRTFDNVWRTNNTLIFKGSCPTFLFLP
jgi:hypothetical protein